jgi:ClpP class serine protease
MKRKHPLTGCYADELFGIWIIEPEAHDKLVSYALKFDLTTLRSQEESTKKELPPKRYKVDGPVGIIEMNGPITKHPDSFGMGASTLRAQQSIRDIVQNEPGVDRILMHIDSPGGTELGVDSLAQFIRKYDSRHLPIYAHGDDRLASAAMWIGSAGRELTASSNTWVGSIGTYAVLEDESGKWEKDGIKRYVVSSDEDKGLGADGKVNERVIKAYQDRVNSLTDLFRSRVSEYRGISMDKLKEIKSRTFIATGAKDHGLINKVCTFDDRLEELKGMSAPTAFRGTVGSRSNIAASDKRSSAMALTAKQLQKVAQLAGAGMTVTAENADVEMFSILESQASQITSLTSQVESTQAQLREVQKKIPKPIDAELLQGRAQLASERFDLLGQQGKLLGPQVTILKNLIHPEGGEINAALLANGPDGKPLYSPFLAMFEINKPNGLNTKITQGQPAPKNEPGDGEDDEIKAALKEMNKKRTANGLMEVTMADLLGKGDQGKRGPAAA